MNRVPAVFIAVMLGMGSTCVFAAGDAEHDRDHPQGAAMASPAAAPGIAPGGADRDMARMGEQMQAMREMHGKMMAAKTPQAREALMAKHTKAMRDGMAMLRRMSERGMGAKAMGGMEMAEKGMGSAAGAGKAAMPMMDMTAHHQMMEQRMQMMTMMMEMMLDRMPAAPTK